MHRSECNFAHHLNFIIDINIKRKLWHKMRYKSGYKRSVCSAAALSLHSSPLHSGRLRLHLSCLYCCCCLCPVKDIMEMMSAGACWPLLSRSARQRPIDQCLVIGSSSRGAAGIAGVETSNSNCQPACCLLLPRCPAVCCNLCLTGANSIARAT